MGNGGHGIAVSAVGEGQVKAWTSAKNIWIAMVMSETSLVTKHGSIITSQRVNGRVWNGNIHNCPARKSSKPNHPQEN